jgi:hypothetical protein
MIHAKVLKDSWVPSTDKGNKETIIRNKRTVKDLLLDFKLDNNSPGLIIIYLHLYFIYLN